MRFRLPIRRWFALLAAVAALLAACAEETPITVPPGEDGHDHEHGADGESIEWEGAPPELDLRIEDGPDGPVAVLEVAGFTFADPDTIVHEPGLGHTHVWVDGRLLGMAHEPTVSLGPLEPGMHHIEVTLASANHFDYVIDGVLLGVSTMLEVAGEAAAADLTIAVEYHDGTIEIANNRYEATTDDTVEITVTSDVAEVIHVHGYDITRDVAAGHTATLRFAADIPGVFEIELEDSGRHLFDLTVK